jgi:Carboxypeptidase regulatory-like domain
MPFMPLPFIRRAVLVAFGVLCAVGGTVRSTQTAEPSRIESQDQTKHAFVIQGTVSGSDAGIALRHAIVTLSTVRGETIAEARADDRGYFCLSVDRSGRYELSANAPGYLTTYWGETGANGVRRRLEIGPRQTTYDVSLSLSRGGAITGRVIDEALEPMEGVPVYALEVAFRAGMDRLVPASAATRLTDDLGRFRLYGLAPGEYYVAVSPGPFGSDGIDRSADREGYAMTFVPGSPNVAAASRLSVGAAQDVETGDVTLVRTRFVEMTGKLVDEHGRPLPHHGVRLLPGSAAGIGLFTEATTAADGTFTFKSLGPGMYTVQTAPTLLQPPRFASRVVSVGERTSIVLEARPGRTVRGVIELEGGGKASYRSDDLDITPTPVDFSASPLGVGARGRVNADSTFDLVDVWGPHRIVVNRTPAGTGLKAILVGDEDVTDRAIDFDKVQSRQLRIILTHRVATLEGVVRDRDGHAVPNCDVVMFPPDRESWDLVSRFVRRTVTDNAGRFLFAGVTPGDYRVAAILELPITRWRQREFLEEMQTSSITVVVSEGQLTRIELAPSRAR